jgi:hypothetical protein
MILVSALYVLIITNALIIVYLLDRKRREIRYDNNRFGINAHSLTVRNGLSLYTMKFASDYVLRTSIPDDTSTNIIIYEDLEEVL